MASDSTAPTTRALASPGSGPEERSTLPAWEYLIVALPRFKAPTNIPGGSAAVQWLNEMGERGWEAVGMTALADGSIAVLCKRPRDDEGAPGG